MPLVILSADGIAVRFSPGLEVSLCILSGVGSRVQSTAVTEGEEMSTLVLPCRAGWDLARQGE